MQDSDKINPLNQKDRELLSDLKSTFDLGTQTIIGQDEDEIIAVSYTHLTLPTIYSV